MLHPGTSKRDVPDTPATTADPTRLLKDITGDDLECPANQSCSFRHDGDGHATATSNYTTRLNGLMSNLLVFNHAIGQQISVELVELLPSEPR